MRMLDISPGWGPTRRCRCRTSARAGTEGESPSWPPYGSHLPPVIAGQLAPPQSQIKSILSSDSQKISRHKIRTHQSELRDAMLESVAAYIPPHRQPKPTLTFLISWQTSCGRRTFIIFSPSEIQVWYESANIFGEKMHQENIKTTSLIPVLMR